MACKYHVRSISLPSRSHPSTLRIEVELNRLKTREASFLSTSELISGGLSGLENLHQCMDDLLSMASTQQVLSQNQHEKCIDELLDGSVRILDICGIARDYMFQIEEHVHALQSALRRRKGDSSIEKDILNCFRFRKEMKKQGKKLITELRQMDNKLGASPLPDLDHHFSAVIRVLREVTVMNTSIFQSLFSFLSAPVPSNRKRWSLVSKLMHKGVISCEEKQENVNEIESVDAALCKHTFDVEKMKIAHKTLVALESSIEGLENRLECVFRHLIKTRASLLNIISQ
ncbi:uncharacterized protein LOC111301096 [Durio zibethinus]|uniref:Uncharacterized protein LOC111301096 n=1 Tax=Durio zibethinus TaxID=66656 RepID=A0A6P5ZIP1_DURZI|nr:uncharacterized protein LOC111301096 [Durio zibethinus]